jgi:hypothetical protein
MGKDVKERGSWDLFKVIFQDRGKLHKTSVSPEF